MGDFGGTHTHMCDVGRNIVTGVFLVVNILCVTVVWLNKIYNSIDDCVFD
jgi:hypothetical protein